MSSDRDREQPDPTAAASGDMYRALYEQGPLPYQSLDEHGRIIDVNRAWTNALGYTRDEVVGRSFADFLHPDWQGHFAANFPEFKRRGVVHDVRFRMRRKDGRDIDVAFEGCIGYASDGSMRQTYCIFQDITERLAAEEALRESEALYRQLFAASPVPTLLSPPYTLRNPNRAAVRLFGYSAEEFASATPASFSPPRQPDGRRSDLASAERIDATLAGDPQVFEWRHRRKDGTEFDAEIRLARVEVGGEPHLLVTIFDLTERREHEERQRLAQERFQSLMEHTSEGFYLFEPSAPLPTDRPPDEQIASLYGGAIVECNDAQARMYGFARAEEVIGKTLADLHGGDDDPENIAFLRAWIANGYQISGAISRETDRDGQDIWLSNNVVGIVEDGVLLRVWGTQTDVTAMKRAEAEREKLQEQLGQAQKLEAVGRLAGGVAHDFNNMLTVILGNVQLALDRPEASAQIGKVLQEIDGAAQRSAELTRQLLAFARKQTIAPQVIDLNETLEGMLKMLRRLIGEDIDLVWQPASRLWSVRVDPGQIDQILANLCVNARDAIAGTGQISIETENVVLEEEDCTAQPGSVPGEFVQLTVSDDGRGMDADTLGFIFEPFFTTKREGEGTGLGLSTVYGIVKQNEGFIDVDSEPGHGTVFRIHLPRHRAAADTATARVQEPMPTGDETILMVEDEPAILDLGRAMLGSLGYEVLTASRPEEAEAVAAARPEEIRLLITDVVLPGMNGRELAGNLGRHHPGLKVLFMSGYTADVIAHHGVLEDGVAFIQKPFSRAELARKVREVLDRDR
jgi:PAS domain S-box-containing protein